MNDINKRIAALSPEKRKLLVEKLKKKNGSVSSHKIFPQGRETNKFPLSFAQQRLWFLDQMEPNSSIYNIPIAFRLTGSLHVHALQQTVNEIVRRHEALRTTFATENGEPVQVISEYTNISLPVVDLCRFPAAKRRTEFERWAKVETDRPFDLAKGPLLRANLLKLDETEHVFFMTIHHIVSDGWSMGVLLRELEAHYRHFSNGEPSSLPALPVQYADFSFWQRNWLQGAELEKQLSFWKKHLAGAPTSSVLPSDRPRPAVQTFSGDVLRVKLPTSLSKSLNKLSRQEGVTLFMTLLATFNTLLYRYTEQEDIVVGSPIANRRPEIENLIGFFVNTMVLRTNISGNLTFRELLSQVQKVTLGAYAHQDLPFEKLVEELQPKRDLSSTPFFQIMFILQNAPLSSFELPGLTLSPLAGESRTSRFDLSLFMAEGDEGLIGMFEFNTDLFDASTIRRMGVHFQRLLESVVENPDQRISMLPMLTEGEKEQLQVQWNATETDYSKEKCFHHLFEDQVKKTPDATAVILEDEEVTYHELNARANCLAHHLKQLGVGPDVLVGICVERSLEMLVGVLGIMKAGGAYVPLDPSYPKERLAYMVEDSGLSILLSQKQVFGELLEDREEGTEDSHSSFSILNTQNKVLCLDSDWQEIAKASDSNPESRTKATNLAYVIYTSGSTGKPKGVAIQHQALVNFLNSMSEEPGLTQEDALLAVTTLSFDIAGLELYLPLLVGARVILASREVASDARRLRGLLTESGATVMQATPATWQLLLDSGWQGQPNLKMLCGGETLPRELANRLLETGGFLWNMYGPTETTIWSSVFQIKSKEKNVPVGPPIDNTQVYILDRYLRLVPIGVYGELHIGGDGLARGYLKRPDLTAEKFIPNPFAENGSRLYCTGDLARYLPNGNLEFQGRIDHQVKIRGFRIELGEIEATLAQHESIDEVVVVAREDASNNQHTEKYLAAYLVSKVTKAPTVSELRRFMLDSLPEYMVPTAFIFLNDFPLTPNGKVDRKALPAPEDNRPDLESVFMAPHNEVERTIAGIWQEVIGVKDVGVEDNFFDLGGHSLLLVQIQSKLATAFNRDLSIIELFKYPTIKAQATYFGLRSDDDTEQRDLSKAQDLARRQRDAFSRQKQMTKTLKRDEEQLKYT